jgi:hypothetical protein
MLQKATEQVSTRLDDIGHPAPVQAPEGTALSNGQQEQALAGCATYEGAAETVDIHADDTNESMAQLQIRPESPAEPEVGDVKFALEPEGNEDDNSRAAAITAAVRRAKTILSQRGPHALQRAAKALRSGQLAPCNRSTFRQLEALHPQGQNIGPLPANRAAEIASLESVLPRVIKRLNNGSAPGVSGWNGSHLAAVWAHGSKDAKEGLHLLLRDVCNGLFSGECCKRLMACRLVPLMKKDGGVRPIAIAELFAKAAAHCAVALVEEDIPKLFPKIQYGVKRPGGSETAAHLIRNLLRDHSAQHPSSTCAIKLDFKNAFNTVSRERVWQTLQQHGCLSSMLKPFYAQYADPTELLVYDRNQLVHKILSTEGVRQGDPFAALAFALSVQPLYTAALEQARAGLADGVSIQDDFTVVGTIEEALKVFDYIREHSLPGFGLELRVDKCQVYLPAETRAAATPEQMSSIQRACEQRQLQIGACMESLGVMHGSDDDIAHFCEDAVDSCEFFFEALEHPELPVQYASLLLRCCQLPRLGYLARTAHPDRLAAAAERFDERALRCWKTIHRISDADLSALCDAESGAASCTVEQLLARISLPVSKGGMGMRPVARTMQAAYLASALEALPELLRLRQHLQAADELSLVDAESSSVFQELAALHAALTRQTATALNRTQRRELQRQAAREAAPANANTPSPHHVATAAAVPTHPTSSSKQTLKMGTDEIWCEASAKASEGEKAAAMPFVRALKLQHDLTAQIEERELQKLMNECRPFQRTILAELNHAPQSGAWLLALPSEPSYRLKDDEYRMAVRKRLGMLPDRSLVEECCLACHGRNTELPQLKCDPHHAEACVAQTATSVTQRHNGVVGVVTPLARSVGGSVLTNQPGFGSGVSTTDPQTG